MRWTSLDDVAAWTELTNELARFDDTDEFYDEEDLAEELTEDGVDPARDLMAVWDGDQLVAYGQVRVRGIDSQGFVGATLSGGVRPSHRGRGIGRELIAREEERAVHLARSRFPGVDIRLKAEGLTDGASVRPLLEHRGYRPVRYFTQMQITDLQDQDLPAPGGITRPLDLTDAGLVEQVRLAHCEAFADHWGSAPPTAQQWADRMGSRSLRPEQSSLVVAHDGTVNAYVISESWVAGELYIGSVGTRRAARGRGLARLALLATLVAAKQAHYAVADLHVDSENPTGALGLYEGLGFRARRVFAAYAKDLPANTVG
ncbi:GNAT family N-acetyltransferase [Branchiibius cervicis]|uniref:GNAT family N-acetyltransferase n=1 Tax=Branchiibius cervicis TaxID=908252 RepID=A0ABW2ARW9_9MICO